MLLRRVLVAVGPPIISREGTGAYCIRLSVISSQHCDYGFLVLSISGSTSSSIGCHVDETEQVGYGTSSPSFDRSACRYFTWPFVGRVRHGISRCTYWVDPGIGGFCFFVGRGLVSGVAVTLCRLRRGCYPLGIMPESSFPRRGFRLRRPPSSFKPAMVGTQQPLTS